MSDTGGKLIALGGIAAAIAYLLPRGGSINLDGGVLSWFPTGNGGVADGNTDIGPFVADTPEGQRVLESELPPDYESGVSDEPRENPLAGYNGWLPDTADRRARAAPYIPTLSRLEREHGLPEGLLVRVAWQESRFRNDIIGGHTRSSVGAIGMFQFMPATARDPGYGVTPLDNPRSWRASAKSAAEYLIAMRDATANWTQALAAYNWGLGNVRQKGLGRAPAETREYYQSITADLGLA